MNFNELEEQLFTGVIADTLDSIGLRSQVMQHHIRPIDPSFKFVGRALTVLATDVYEEPENPYEKELEAVDALEKDDVMIVTTNGSTTSSFWGELLSTVAIEKGSRGVVIDGFTRDSRPIIDLGFPTFTSGFHPSDSKGRLDVIDYKIPIECGGVKVHNGDLVFADFDGIVVIPQAHGSEVFEKALEKVEAENKMREELKKGMGIIEAHKKYDAL
ncbi:RraA family protein [Salicibibacter cibi]|uniref:Putative 4-hydroxy-4-methyl-2-oxoglutarate aldolase n=1 Tax=Salicibibacter cibi TaxID=2743001 RepID=A0A7T6Z9F0_9BACI|nr:RraA family protein [Salicibibacter cibi]QQK78851.1 RraA family protein [Salicibibacter cibi]